MTDQPSGWGGGEFYSEGRLPGLPLAPALFGSLSKLVGIATSVVKCIGTRLLRPQHCRGYKLLLMHPH